MNLLGRLADAEPVGVRAGGKALDVAPLVT